MTLILRKACLLAVAMAAFTVTAEAQTPQRTTATYDDWTVRCETTTATPPVKTCEMVQATQIQGQPNPITQIAIGRPSKTEPFRLVMQVPPNVWLATGAKLVYDAKQAGISAQFTRCLAVGCFADLPFTDDMGKKLRDRTDPGRLEFKDATQRDVAIPVSFKGFGQALDGLAKE